MKTFNRKFQWWAALTDSRQALNQRVHSLSVIEEKS